MVLVVRAQSRFALVRNKLSQTSPRFASEEIVQEIRSIAVYATREILPGLRVAMGDHRSGALFDGAWSKGFRGHNDFRQRGGADGGRFAFTCEQSERTG